MALTGALLIDVVKPARVGDAVSVTVGAAAAADGLPDTLAMMGSYGPQIYRSTSPAGTARFLIPGTDTQHSGAATPDRDCRRSARRGDAHARSRTFRSTVYAAGRPALNHRRYATLDHSAWPYLSDLSSGQPGGRMAQPVTFAYSTPATSLKYCMPRSTIWSAGQRIFSRNERRSQQSSL